MSNYTIKRLALTIVCLLGVFTFAYLTSGPAMVVWKGPVKNENDVKTIINAFVKNVDWYTSANMKITPPPHDNSRLASQWSVKFSDQREFHIDEASGKITFAYRPFGVKTKKIVNLTKKQALKLAEGYLACAGLRTDDLQVDSNEATNHTQNEGATRWDVTFRKTYQGVLFNKSTGAIVDLDPKTGDLIGLGDNCDFAQPPSAMTVNIHQDTALQMAQDFFAKANLAIGGKVMIDQEIVQPNHYWTIMNMPLPHKRVKLPPTTKLAWVIRFSKLPGVYTYMNDKEVWIDTNTGEILGGVATG